MNWDGISRRQLLLYSSAALASRAAGMQHQHQSPSADVQPQGLKFFTSEQASEVESLAALIIPADETPGAREAGVIHFIDEALATFDQDKGSIYRSGLQQVQKEVNSLDPHAQRIADLPPQQQLQLMERIADSPFFEVVRTHTVMGFLGTPARGGNKDEMGWKLIEFEDQFTFHPPFGYYDSKAGSDV